MENNNENERNVNDYIKGRGAQFNTPNKFLKNQKVREHVEAIDDWTEPNVETQYFEDNAKGIVNKVDSPDVGMWYSMNPYPGLRAWLHLLLCKK